MHQAEQHSLWLTEAREHEHTPETVEYGISSFVFRAKRPFHPVRLQDTLGVFVGRGACHQGAGQPVARARAHGAADVPVLGRAG